MPSSLPSVTVIVPTYHEAENLPYLIGEIEQLKDSLFLDLELLIMDDNSQDGTEEIILKLNLPWVHLKVRYHHRGLSPAVVEGFGLAKNDVIVVMDGDLSHPVNVIPEMLRHINQGYEFVIGSRYVTDSSVDKQWGFLRWLNSKAACLMAWPLTTLKDPMSGFFAFRKALLVNLLDKKIALNPVGYKIGLELLVKIGCSNLLEIPIRFSERKYGKSKLSLKEQLRYIQHLRRLFFFKYPEQSHFIQFLVIGILGTFINLAILTGALYVGLAVQPALILGVAVSMLSNFALNRRFAFSYARNQNIVKQFIDFVTTCLLGAILNYICATNLLQAFPSLIPQLAELVGIAVGTAVNYTTGRIFVFRKKA